MNDYFELEDYALAALKSAKTANERIDNLPLPMVFKGSLGTGGTISTLPTASSENEGFVYIVITDGTYAGQVAKAGDTFVSDGSSWVLIPAGDEPSVIDDSVISTALTWSSDKISKEYKIKNFTYTGDDSLLFDITIPDDAKYILSIQADFLDSQNRPCTVYTQSIDLNKLLYWLPIYCVLGGVGFSGKYNQIMSFTNNKLRLQATATQQYLNINSVVYTVYYI